MPECVVKTSENRGLMAGNPLRLIHGTDNWDPLFRSAMQKKGLKASHQTSGRATKEGGK